MEKLLKLLKSRIPEDFVIVWTLLDIPDSKKSEYILTKMVENNIEYKKFYREALYCKPSNTYFLNSDICTQLDIDYYSQDLNPALTINNGKITRYVS